VTKRRPALALSAAPWNAASGHVMAAMTTSGARSGWPGDVALSDLAAAGPEAACVVRGKLFTIPAELVARRAGALGAAGQEAVGRVPRGGKLGKDGVQRGE
jgi:mRNA interferase MazF